MAPGLCVDRCLIVEGWHDDDHSEHVFRAGLHEGVELHSQSCSVVLVGAVEVRAVVEPGPALPDLAVARCRAWVEDNAVVLCGEREYCSPRS